MTLLLLKASLLYLQLIRAIVKGGKQVIKILMISNMKVYTSFWLSIQLIPLKLEDLFPFALPLKMHQ